MDYDAYKTPEAQLTEEQPEIELASRFSRLAASIIDSLFLSILSFSVMYLTGGFEDIQAGIQPTWQYSLFLSAAVITGFIAINGISLVRSGQTLGKKVLKIKIVDLDDQLPSVNRHLLPWYATYFIPGQIPVIGSIFSIANILFIFGKERRCLHDRFAGTRVVRC